MSLSEVITAIAWQTVIVAVAFMVVGFLAGVVTARLSSRPKGAHHYGTYEPSYTYGDLASQRSRDL